MNDLGTWVHSLNGCGSQCFWHCGLKVTFFTWNPALCIPSCKCYDNMPISDYPRIPSKLRGRGFSMALFHMTRNWTGISRNPQGVRDKLTEIRKYKLQHVIAEVISVSAGAYVCVQCRGKSQGSQVGVGAQSDIIEFIKGKSCLCFPWRSYGGSDITMVKQQTVWCPWLLSGCGYIQNQPHVFSMTLSCPYVSVWGEEVCTSLHENPLSLFVLFSWINEELFFRPPH